MRFWLVITNVGRNVVPIDMLGGEGGVIRAVHGNTGCFIHVMVRDARVF